jgi:hypothetical protein
MKGPLPEINDRSLVADFLAAEKDLGLLQMLRGLNSADKIISAKRNAILIISEGKPLEVKQYRDAPDALRALFELEKEMPDRDIVLVRADTSEDVRLAFKNYFSDARDFLRLIDDGCARLSRATQIRGGISLPK